MITVDQQLHGYRQGHELLASSIKLDKSDQELVNRLSDIAGPLRPGESFDAYLTAYPLPSGTHYVLSRTWQDLEVLRAGCVRTFSLLIPMSDWETVRSLAPFLALLNTDISPVSAERISIEPTSGLPLPSVMEFQAIELLEAMFLEVRKPIVVFDASDAELMAVRLLTAFWPSFRRSFCVSTFVLSPRKMIGRSFDLVFAPKDARSRFANWDGRRIDMHGGNGRERHPWAGYIAKQVFTAPHPRLLDEDEAGLLASDDSGSEATLRIALLWNDLQTKLEQSPTAVLGLLDIANTRSKRDVAAIRNLEPALVRAASQAVATMPEKDAWTFLGAMTHKLQDLRIDLSSAKSIRALAIELATRDPASAVEAVVQSEGRKSSDFLLGAVANGLARRANNETDVLLAEAPASVLVRLLTASPTLAEKALAGSGEVLTALAQALPTLDPQLFDEARRRLLRLLVEDWHIPAAAPIIATLNANELADETKHLYEANKFASAGMSEHLAARAHKIGAEAGLRDMVQRFGPEQPVEHLIAGLLKPRSEDLAWVLHGHMLDARRRVSLLVGLLRSASQGDLRCMLSDRGLLDATLSALPDGPFDLLDRIARDVSLPLTAFVRLVIRILSTSQAPNEDLLVRRALDRCLHESFEGDEVATIIQLLCALGGSLDGAWAVRRGVDRGVPALIASRNLIAFNKAPPDSRERIVGAVEDLARVLEGRYVLDINSEAVEACAALFWSAETVASKALLRASRRLLPFLMRARYEPASPLIAAVFPSVYRDLSKGGELPDILDIFIFVDWDRCKVARRELVDAFLASNWRPSDLALAGARAGSLSRILGRLIRQEGGEHYLRSIERDVSLVPLPWQAEVSAAIDKVRSGLS
ncbi:hypothetical protein K5D53_22365 [Pseudomonas cichorii]|nr:hypothetical protein [Pseudomonas cichorii]MBX8596761.1 hypothetical protein [Pseudomonas cichorii]